MCNRITATTKLLYLIKVASVELSKAHFDEDMESLVIEAGIHALKSLGVSADETAQATIDLVLGLPMLGNVDNDSTVSTRDGEDTEGESSTHTDPVSGLSLETSRVHD